MPYKNLNNARYEYLLIYGVDDSELRRFFLEYHKQLIIKGAKVQNLPRGHKSRVTTMVRMPSSTDSIVQKWFSSHISMIDPTPVDELIETFHLFEEENEELSESDKKRLSRSCLIWLFEENPSVELIEYLRTKIGEDASNDADEQVDVEDGGNNNNSMSLLEANYINLTEAIIALIDGADPDEYLVDAQPDIANILSCIYAVVSGDSEYALKLIEGIDGQDEIKDLLVTYLQRYQENKDSPRSSPTGLMLIEYEEFNDYEYDIIKDNILGICTRDVPETAVFIRPIAIQTSEGRLISLDNEVDRKSIFPVSGDVQAFKGHQLPKQPKRNEIGVWQVAPNNPDGNATYFNNYHLSRTKINVYEMHQIPFESKYHDSVREYIKQYFSRKSNSAYETLFLLRDGLIVGGQHGADMTKDAAFDEGLPSWGSLPAIRFEGRYLVLGPLPASRQYECATLASILKDYFSSVRESSEKLSKAQQKFLLTWVAAEQSRLNSERHLRLLNDIEYLASEEETAEIIISEAMSRKEITDKVEQKVDELTQLKLAEKEGINTEIKRLRKTKDELKAHIDTQKKEQAALPSLVKKALKKSISKAQADAFGKLGEVFVFNALMDMPSIHHDNVQSDISVVAKHNVISHDEPLVNLLKANGLSSKYIKALKLTAQVIFDAGMILIIEGLSARLIADAWGNESGEGCELIDCAIGMTDYPQLNQFITDGCKNIVILDANLSPIDVYARTIIDAVQLRILKQEAEIHPNIILSLSESVASLPLPNVVQSIAIRISADDKCEYIRENEASDILQGIDDDGIEEGGEYVKWGPALKSLQAVLRNLPVEELALVLSVIKDELLYGN